MNRATPFSNNYKKDHMDSPLLLYRKQFKKKCKLFLNEENVNIIDVSQPQFFIAP